MVLRAKHPLGKLLQRVRYDTVAQLGDDSNGSRARTAPQETHLGNLPYWSSQHTISLSVRAKILPSE